MLRPESFWPFVVYANDGVTTIYGSLNSADQRHRIEFILRVGFEDKQRRAMLNDHIQWLTSKYDYLQSNDPSQILEMSDLKASAKSIARFEHLRAVRSVIAAEQYSASLPVNRLDRPNCSQ